MSPELVPTLDLTQSWIESVPLRSIVDDKSSYAARLVVAAAPIRRSALAVPSFLSVVSAVVVTRVDETEVQAESASESVLSVTPLAITEPLRWTELLDSLRPAWMVSLPLSEEKIPVDSTVKAKTEATTTKAIRIMAVSRPVTPRWSLTRVRTFLLISFGKSTKGFIICSFRL